MVKMSVGEKYVSKNKNPLVVDFPYSILYKHTFGEVSPFFVGLKNKRLLGTVCRNNDKHKNGKEILYLPPRADCPECMAELTEWVDLTDADIRIYTYTTAYFAGETFLNRIPYTLINIDVKGYDNSYSKLTSTLVINEPGEINIDLKDIRIGMKIKPKFRDVPLEKVDASTLYFVPAEK
ncbi:MAG: Zn-ribbon domain-containing OB-fold protein [Thermoplasmata archaeon]